MLFSLPAAGTPRRRRVGCNALPADAICAKCVMKLNSGRLPDWPGHQANICDPRGSLAEKWRCRKLAVDRPRVAAKRRANLRWFGSLRKPRPWAMVGNARQRSRQNLHSLQRRIYNLQIVIRFRAFESHPHRQIVPYFDLPLCYAGLGNARHVTNEKIEYELCTLVVLVEPIPSSYQCSMKLGRN